LQRQLNIILSVVNSRGELVEIKMCGFEWFHGVAGRKVGVGVGPGLDFL